MKIKITQLFVMPSIGKKWWKYWAILYNWTSWLTDLYCRSTILRYIFYRTVDKRTKEDALKLVEEVTTETTGFRPFELDNDKQDRYEKYLKFIKIGAKGMPKVVASLR